MDLRTVSFDVPPQEILTRDSVTVAVDAVVYYRLFWMRMIMENIGGWNGSTVEISCWADLAQPLAGIKSSPKNFFVSA